MQLSENVVSRHYCHNYSSSCHKTYIADIEMALGLYYLTV